MIVFPHNIISGLFYCWMTAKQRKAPTLKSKRRGNEGRGTGESTPSGTMPQQMLLTQNGLFHNDKNLRVDVCWKMTDFYIFRHLSAIQKNMRRTTFKTSRRTRFWKGRKDETWTKTMTRWRGKQKEVKTNIQMTKKEKPKKTRTGMGRPSFFSFTSSVCTEALSFSEICKWKILKSRLTLSENSYIHILGSMLWLQLLLRINFYTLTNDSWQAVPCAKALVMCSITTN